MLAVALLAGGISMDAKTTKKKAKAKSTKTTSSSFSADLPTIKQTVTKFYEGAVIGESRSIPWTKSSLSNYCTSTLIKKLAREYREEYGESGGYAVYNLRGDASDSDPRDKVISVDADTNNSVIVTYTDCGFTCKTRLYMKMENGKWKINDYKFISQSSTSKFSEWN